MTRGYLDTSAPLKLVIEEAESSALAAAVDDEVALVGTWPMEIEMRRAAKRVTALTQEAVTRFLEGVDLDAKPACSAAPASG